MALGLLECIKDLLKQSFNIHAGRISLGLMTFIPPVLFSLFYPEGFILALGCRSNVCVLRGSFTGGISLEGTLNLSKLAISRMGR